MATPPVGGFFELHVPQGSTGGASVLEIWSDGHPWSAFAHARGAFAALVRRHPRAKVWLPAFLCRDMADAAFADRTRIFGVDEALEPELQSVIEEARSGDLVLLVSYFGRSCAGAARSLLKARPDLFVVEDCAQALEPGPDFPAHWRLFSPRKLLGVADGGLLVARSPDVPIPRPTSPADPEVWKAPLLRFRDPAGCRNDVWHAANQSREAEARADDRAMTRLSAAILSRTPMAALAAARRANAALLDARLGRFAAVSFEAATPLGYVLKLDPDRRDRVRRALQAQRIFAAVHWPSIVGAPDLFPRENAWTRQLLTLPCDHRYGADEMHRIADAVEQALA